ncbi:MAG TPA: transcriptional regulator [Bdellovibrionales bacterium]|nr:transcriptional regulator [Bdellovibrionales bacterium]
MNPHDLMQTNPLLSDRVRLAIMALLTGSKDEVDFKTLLDRLELTKGNLSSHMRKLEEAGLVDVHKSFVDRKPLTTYSVSAKGREEIRNYLAKVEAVLQSAMGR